jgi:pre-mycofactocin synthase
MLRFAPEGILRPRYLLDRARHGALPDLTTPNLVGAGEDPPTFFEAYGEWTQTPLLTWEDIAWLREQWGGRSRSGGSGRSSSTAASGAAATW